MKKRSCRMLTLACLTVVLLACSTKRRRPLSASGPAMVTRPSYGARTLVVAANVHWLNTGLFLRRGETANLISFGAWSAYPSGDLHGPEGKNGSREGCRPDSLVASIGLRTRGELHCVGRAARVIAPRDGVLYLKINDGLLEDNRGAVTVAVQSGGRVNDPIACGNIRRQHPALLRSAPEVELTCGPVGLIVPGALVAAHHAQADASLVAFRRFYESHRALAGAVPYGGERVRVAPDAGVGWMVMGNPIFVHPRAMSGSVPGSNAMMAHDRRYSVWGWAHELGHDFTLMNDGRYKIGDGPSEAWANVFTLYTLEHLGYPEQRREICKEARRYVSQGQPYSVFRNDAWIPLCMLMELEQRHGWPLFERFFRSYNHSPIDHVPDRDADDATRWRWLRNALSHAAGADVTPVLRKYRIPL
jgi:hypothetical protein